MEPALDCEQCPDDGSLGLLLSFSRGGDEWLPVAESEVYCLLVQVSPRRCELVCRTPWPVEPSNCSSRRIRRSSATTLTADHSPYCRNHSQKLPSLGSRIPCSPHDPSGFLRLISICDAPGLCKSHRGRGKKINSIGGHGYNRCPRCSSPYPSAYSSNLLCTPTTEIPSLPSTHAPISVTWL